MKTQKQIFAVFILLLILFWNSAFSQFPVLQKSFEPNTISTYFWNTGVFNQNHNTGNQPGFMWPRNSNKFCIFTTGLNIAALVNDSLRMASVSYKGEYYTGYMNGGLPYNDTNFRIYKVTLGDNASNNPDYANWGVMVPFGAPYYDVNHNGQYDPGIDTPGVRNAQQTIFICMTDGFTEMHTPSEGFGGGTLPLKADLRLTAWGYTFPGFEDVQFIKFQIINKNVSSWTHTFSGLFADPDVGDPMDDYIGCDTSRKLCYCYNGENIDLVYGLAPPAVGFLLLKGLVNHGVIPNANIGLTSFIDIKSSGSSTSQCEWDPSPGADKAYNRLKGLKNDGSSYLNPLVYPRIPTKFLFTGDPETNTGWTQTKGRISNCGTDTGIFTPPPSSNDARLLMGMGAENFTMNSGDTQTIVISQLLSRGSSNLNSVTKLKQLANTVSIYYNSGLSFNYSVSGNVKFQDNNQTVTSGSVKAFYFNPASGQILVEDSAAIQSDGSYILNNVWIGDSYIGAVPNSTTQQDYVLTYFPSTIYYQNATVLDTIGNVTGINIRVFRMSQSITQNSVNGMVNSLFPVTPVKDANIYAKSGNDFVGYATSASNGIYHLNSLPTGTLKIIVNRIGFSGDSTTVNLNKSLLDSVNFYLTKLFIGVKQISSEIPDKFLLYQNYPNPFNPSTIIKYQITESKFVSLKVFDVLGKEIANLVNEKQKAGVYETTFNAGNLSSGIYFYRIVAGDYSETKKMLMIK